MENCKFRVKLQYLWFCYLIIIMRANVLVCLSKTAEREENYIIHMNLDAMPRVFADHSSWYSSTLRSLSRTRDSSIILSSNNNNNNDDDDDKLLYSYTHAIHGFSARLTQAELEALKRVPGYLHSTRDNYMPVKRDTTHSPKFLGLTHSYGAWPASQYGKDIIIGLVDTGITPESKSFSDHRITSPVPSKWKGTCEEGTKFTSSMCNNKLIGARYFNRALVKKRNHNMTISMNSARDTAGHGTHTSSTAAGSPVEGASYFGYGTGTATGMAPSARVAMYKALWDEGETTADIIAAIDAAIKDGVDVLSISLGVDVAHFSNDPVAIATYSAAEQGIFVSLSAGNEGPDGGFLHNGTPWATTVAAGTTDRLFGGTIKLHIEEEEEDDDKNSTVVVVLSIEGSTLYPLKTTIAKAPILFMGGCDDSKLLKKKLNNYTVAVCLDINGTAVPDQIQNIGDVQVAGAIFITNTTDLEIFISQASYPSIFLDPKTGKSLTDYITKSKFRTTPLVSMDFQKTYIGGTGTGSGSALIISPKAAVYTSRGPSPTCPSVLKPDLMAPGDMILASWTRVNPVAIVKSSGALYSDFRIESGTSMSCPHVAGVAALIKGAHPDWSPAAIRSALITTADPLDNTGQPIKDYDNRPASALTIGAGQINPNKALHPGLVYDLQPGDYVRLLCSLNYSHAEIRVITRSSSRTHCSKQFYSPADFNYPSFILLLSTNNDNNTAGSYEEYDFTRVVTNVGEGPSSTYQVKVEGFKQVGGPVRVTVEPNRLVFNGKNQKLSFKVRVKAKGPAQGSITWVDTQGKYVVRSPLVVTRARAVVRTTD